ncbi:MAG: L,D-transpeptidase family protein, partial [Algicola sp.]|nr:L,D-transpeptidase family protein [Algicola sp.]
SRLYIFSKDKRIPKLIKDYYASSGKAGADKQVSGDNKTPIGVYFVTKRIPASRLPSKYGAGAFPLNYPNSWDSQLKKTGNGIWLHGSPIETYSRPPQASEGCISLTNFDFAELDKLVDIKSTPVIIGRNIQWISKEQWHKQQQQFNNLISTWAADWESLDNDQYMTNYSADFKNGRDTYHSWSKRKEKVNKRKSFIKIEVANLSLFTYPDDKGMLVASFQQKYQSDNYNGSHSKRQYWRKENDTWKVVYEGKPSKGRP